MGAVRGSYGILHLTLGSFGFAEVSECQKNFAIF